MPQDFVDIALCVKIPVEKDKWRAEVGVDCSPDHDSPKRNCHDIVPQLNGTHVFYRQYDSRKNEIRLRRQSLSMVIAAGGHDSRPSSILFVGVCWFS